jgi:hypothetical protein
MRGVGAQLEPMSDHVLVLGSGETGAALLEAALDEERGAIDDDPAEEQEPSRMGNPGSAWRWRN